MNRLSSENREVLVILTGYSRHHKPRLQELYKHGS